MCGRDYRNIKDDLKAYSARLAELEIDVDEFFQRVAAFNGGKLFDRANLCNDLSPDAHREVLEAHESLNKLSQTSRCSKADNDRMIEWIGILVMLGRDEGCDTSTRIRKIFRMWASGPQGRARHKRLGKSIWKIPVVF